MMSECVCAAKSQGGLRLEAGQRKGCVEGVVTRLDAPWLLTDKAAWRQAVAAQGRGPTSRASRLRRSCSSNSSASRLMSAPGAAALKSGSGWQRVSAPGDRRSDWDKPGGAGTLAPASAELKATSARRFCRSASRSSSSLASSALLRSPSASCSTNSSTWQRTNMQGRRRNERRAQAGWPGSWGGRMATGTGLCSPANDVLWAVALRSCRLQPLLLTRFFPISNSSCFTRDSCSPLSPWGASCSSG